MRVIYLYDFNGDGELEVWNHTYKYQQTDVSGVTKNFETAPLAVLPIGTELELKEVSRTNKFDSSPDAIYVLGKLLHDNEHRKFVYLWGIRNTIGYAPWESATFNPRANDRFVGCEI